MISNNATTISNTATPSNNDTYNEVSLTSVTTRCYVNGLVKMIFCPVLNYDKIVYSLLMLQINYRLNVRKLSGNIIEH